MRKFKWIFILLVLIIFSTTIVFAENNDLIQVGMNNEKVDVRLVDVLLDGQALEFTVPSFILVDRTLVPVRFVAENYGAEVSWDQSSKTATILFEDKKVDLTIDSPLAKINGQAKVLDKNSIPKLVTYPDDAENAYTVIPFAFISEMLGYEYGYDEAKGLPYISSKPIEVDNDEKDDDKKDNDKKDEVVDSLATITDIYVDKGSTDKNKLVIKSSGKISYKSEVLSRNDKLIIDIEDALLNIKGKGDKAGSISVRDDDFTKVEYSQYSLEPDIVRVVISMTDDDLDYDIAPSTDGKTSVVSFVNKIEDFSIEHIDDKDLILIEGNDKIEYNIIKLKGPERIVIDIMDASLSYGTYHEFDFDLGFIKGVRVSQFQADNNYSPLDRIVRVVLDIKDVVLDPLIKIDNVDNTLIIYPENNLWEDISYEVDGKDRFITINNEESSRYEVENYPDKKTLAITIPSDLSGLEEGHVYVKDGLIEEIEVVKDRRNTVIQVRYNKSIVFDILSRTRDDSIVLQINRNLDVKPSERIIVIDPGHGGSDPGAISITGRHEKDLNLSVAKKLKEGLSDLGYNLVMTRDEDTNLGLYERSNLANDIYADLFISIHGNSLAKENDLIRGIEVYYWPANKSQIKIEDQYPFAKSIHDELIKATGATSRGIKTNPYVVIRETRMPAVLIESGFLSNPEEESLLYTEDYQNKLSEGILKGIESYFEMY